MSANIDYKSEIVKRTKVLLETQFERLKTNDKEVTFLMNCLLGLVVAISEQEKTRHVFNKPIDDDFIDNLPNQIGFVEGVKNTGNMYLVRQTSLTIPVRGKNDLGTKKQDWFIRKVRNCIAHQNIEAINEKGKWEKVRMWNINPKWGMDFEMVIDCNDLKKFAIFLAKKFVDEK